MGEMMLVLESPMRNIASTKAGSKSIIISMGTNTGAINAHWAEPLVMKMLRVALMTMNAPTSGSPVKPVLWRMLEPSMAIYCPSADQPK